ncbi:33492_t:CDS:2, partial [Racocetra persica]
KETFTKALYLFDKDYNKMSNEELIVEIQKLRAEIWSMKDDDGRIKKILETHELSTTGQKPTKSGNFPFEFLLILIVETSCDETSTAILENKKVLSNITISQILEQQKYGGVMPSLAAKLHIKNIQKVLKKTLFTAKISPKQIDYIAYTEKPGLIISLALIISGGHTQMYQVNNHFDFILLGETCDDAIGECLDKSAILLGYNYPGGPIIEKLAQTGKNTYRLPFPKNDESFDFSFSGLKSEISRLISKEKENINVNDLACSLQCILAEILTKKLKKAWLTVRAKTIIIGGGIFHGQCGYDWNLLFYEYLKEDRKKEHLGRDNKAKNAEAKLKSH